MESKPQGSPDGSRPMARSRASLLSTTTTLRPPESPALPPSADLDRRPSIRNLLGYYTRRVRALFSIKHVEDLSKKVNDLRDGNNLDKLDAEKKEVGAAAEKRRNEKAKKLAVDELSDEQEKQGIKNFRSEELGARESAPARSTDGFFRATVSSDLLFLMDATGSMGGHIRAAKDQVKHIIKDIRQNSFFNDADLRVAVVGYKDHGDGASRIAFLDFTSDDDRVFAFLSELRAFGGKDLPEDVLGGIQQAINASWVNPTRCIIHIGDSPPHGRTLHDLERYQDDYYEPGSEPHQLTYEPLIEQLITLRINYGFLRIRGYTDRMAFAFSRLYAARAASSKLHPSNKYYGESVDGNPPPPSGGPRRGTVARLQFEEHALGSEFQRLWHLVVGSITTSASRTAVDSPDPRDRVFKTKRPLKAMVGLEEVDEEVEEVVVEEEEEEEAEEEEGGHNLDSALLETSPPRWDQRGWLDSTCTAETYTTDPVQSTSATLDDVILDEDEIKISATLLTVMRRSRPFAQGALRLAAYARTPASDNHLVVKWYKRKPKRNGKQLARVAEDMRCQALCKTFALEFNSLAGEEHSLDFVVATCLKSRGGECMTLEPYMDGTYVKYNSNSGYVSDEDSPANKAAQAFSHYTFERSRGRLLACDLQGVGSLLTDPAIHTRDSQRFKLSRTNLHEDGFKFFFLSHRCNAICTTLGLKSDGSMILSGDYQFRTNWPRWNQVTSISAASAASACCSNKLCSVMVRLAVARESDEFPGYRWCDSCWTQLRSSKVTRQCVTPGPFHDFEACKFFYESQAQNAPRRCPDHRNPSQRLRGGGL